MAIDVFLTSADVAVRERVRDRLRMNAGLSQPGASSEKHSPDLRGLWDDLVSRDLSGSGALGPEGLVGAALAVEECSRASPRLGRALMAAWKRPRRRSGPEQRSALDAAWSLGTAASVYESCLKAAREGGYFESTLMGHLKVQLDLAELLSELESARVQAYRAFHLIDRGRAERGRNELARAAKLAGTARQTAEALAVGLLGQDWTGTLSPGGERSRP